MRADRTLPPEMRVPGHSLSHEAKRLDDLKRDRSGPISETTLSAVEVSMPSIRVRSTPVRRYSRVRASKSGAFFCLCPLRLSGPGLSSRAASAASKVSSLRSQALICAA